MPIVEEVPDSGAYEWTIDPSIPDGNFYKIRISSIAVPSVYGETPSYFTIGAAFFPLTLNAVPEQYGATTPSGVVHAVKGSYQIQATPSGGNSFVRWSAEGGARIVNGTLMSTVATISGDATITAYFSGVNVAVGTKFKLQAANVPGMDQFSSKPIVYAANGDTKYGNLTVKPYNVLEITCEWTAKAPCAEYSLMVRVGNGTPAKADLGFSVMPPSITSVTPLPPGVESYVTVTGAFWGKKTPQIWLSCVDETGRAKKVNLRIDHGTFYFDPNDTVTGRSGLRFFMPKSLPKGTLSATLFLKNTLDVAQYLLW